MAVPNTTTFNLQDVKTELGSSSNDLVSFFSEADDDLFDPAYVGSKNSLLNFRNYGGEILTVFEVSNTTYGGLMAACSGSPAYSTKYFNRTGPFPFPEIGDIIYNDSGLTTPFNGGDNFYKLRRDGIMGSNQIGTTGIAANTTTLCS